MTAPRPPVPSFPPDAPEAEFARRAALAEYIRTHEGRYTRAALAAAAREAGYSPAEIDAAFEPAIHRSPGSDIRPSKTIEGVITSAWTIPVAIVYVVAIVALVFGGRGDTAGVALVIALVGGVVGAVLLRNRNPGVARGLACGVVVVIAVSAVLLLGLYGFCLVTGLRVL